MTCSNCGSSKHPVQELLGESMEIATKCVDCGMIFKERQDTIPASPPPQQFDIIGLAKRRLTELDAKLAQYESLMSEREMLMKMLKAVES